MSNNSYWEGQQIHISKAEVEDGDSHYNNFDLDLEKGDE